MTTTTILKDEAYGVYKGPLYPELQDEEARLCRYSGDWIVARFLTEGVSINPTGESFHVDPSTCWILFHADDFDIIRGELSPCDWCSSFDFRCTGTCKRIGGESVKDGALVMPAIDPLKELARLIGQGDPPFAPPRLAMKPFSYTDCTWPECDCGETDICRRNPEQPDAYLRRKLEAEAAHKQVVQDVERRSYQYTTRLVMIIAVCWFITGVCLGWWGTYTWPWW
jgi:hypothetical protein